MAQLSRKTWRRSAAALALVGLALSLTGCMRLTYDLTVNVDDTISGETVFAFSDQLLEMAGTTFDEAMAQGGQEGLLSNTYGGRAKIEDYAADGYTGKLISLDALPLSEFGVSQEESGMQLNIAKDGSQYKVSGGMDLSSQDVDPAQLEEYGGFDVQVSITFPGPVVSSNGDVNGNTVAWKIVPGQTNEFEATANSGGGSQTMLVVGLIALGVLVVGGVIAILLVRKSKKRKVTVAGPEGEAFETVPGDGAATAGEPSEGEPSEGAEGEGAPAEPEPEPAKPSAGFGSGTDDAGYTPPPAAAPPAPLARPAAPLARPAPPAAPPAKPAEPKPEPATPAEEPKPAEPKPEEPAAEPKPEEPKPEEPPTS
ncbi:MAG: DUF3153 domain-containing protein [Bifidobacteriaceae bacterium]|jgi:hypothetical protein|nr:DUF3153 domain-containing protein [Bifidobacteriaceae bacterium]